MSEAEVRRMLSAVYGETPTNEIEEASGLEATREGLSEYVNAPLEGGVRARLKSTVAAELSRPSTAAAKISAMRGSVWYQRPQEQTVFTASGPLAVTAGMRVGCIKGGSAMVTFLDGTTLALAGGSELELGAAENAPAASLRSGRFYAWVTRQQQGRPFRLQTPEGIIAVLGTEFDVQLDQKHETRVTVTEGCVTFQAAASGSNEAIRLERGAQVRARRGRSQVRALGSAELMLCGGWARRSRGGQSRLAMTGAILLVAALGIGGYQFLRPSASSPQAQSTAAPAGGSVQAPPVSSVRATPAATYPGWEDMSFVSRGAITVSDREADGWRLSNSLTYEARVEPTSGDRITRMFDLVLYGADGRPQALPPGISLPTYRQNAAGIRLEGVPEPIGVQAVQSMNVIAYDPAILVPVPGATGRRTGTLKGALPQVPGATYQMSYAVEPAGSGTSTGRPTDLYKVKVEGSVGEVDFPPVQNGTVLMRRKLKRRIFRSEGQLQFLAGTNEAAEFLIHEQRIDEVWQRLEPQDGKPVESNLPRSQEDVQIHIQFEPLSR
jgi:hypothetical protein